MTLQVINTKKAQLNVEPFNYKIKLNLNKMTTTKKTTTAKKTTFSPKKKKLTFVNKTYKLTKDKAPLSYSIPSRNTKRKSLLWFDEETGVNRALRYSRNQKSIFEDEQDENVILEPIVFEDGLLFVPKENQILQKLEK